MTDREGKVADLAAKRARRTRQRGCPICGVPAVAAYRPFCSRRCADIDLGRWLKEGYRVPTEEGPGGDETGPRRDED